jgi:hypothetical protein
MSPLENLPQDCLDLICHHLQPAEKGLARLARANKQLFKAVECSTLAWAEVDGSRLLVSADDKELAAVFVAPDLTARSIVALNFSGLERVRGFSLCDLFRGPTPQTEEPASFAAAAAPAVEAPLPSSVTEKRSLRRALQPLASPAAAEEALTQLVAAATKPRLGAARLGRGALSGVTGLAGADMGLPLRLYPSLGDGDVRAVKLQALDLSHCALLDPHALVAALGGCPVLEIL